MEGMNGSIVEILPVFKNWQRLNRLCLLGQRSVDAAACPSLNLVRDFILDMTSLTHLRICDRLNNWEEYRFRVEVWELRGWMEQNRPGFKFEVANSKYESDYLFDGDEN